MLFDKFVAESSDSEQVFVRYYPAVRGFDVNMEQFEQDLEASEEWKAADKYDFFTMTHSFA